MPTVKEVFDNARTSPEFKKLDYAHQQVILKNAIDKVILQDPAFQAIPDAKKAEVYAGLINTKVRKWTPALNSFDGQLTDEDRAALSQGLLTDAPGTQDSYKRGLWLLERMDAGDPSAAGEAKTWIAANSVKTSSLLIQIGTGIKDAAETLFAGDKPRNSLALNTQDYHKLADAMYSRMKPDEAQSAKTISNIAGAATRMVGTVALNTVFVGGAFRPPLIAKAWPGVFTEKMWEGMELKAAMATTSQAQRLWGSFMPMVADATLGGGVTDVLRSLPNLLETGRLQGDKAFWEQAASTFGEGVAFDMMANIGRSVIKYAAKPLKAAIRSVGIGDLGVTKESIKNAAGELDPDKVAAIVNDAFTGNVNGELFESLPKEAKEAYYKEVIRIKSLMMSSSFDPNSDSGFKMISKAMGFDAEIDDQGLIHVFDVNNPFNEIGAFQSKVEAVDFYRSLSWGAGTAPEDALNLGGSGNVRMKAYARTKLTVSDLPTEQLVDSISAGTRGLNMDKETVTSSIQELARRTGNGAVQLDFMNEATWLSKLKSGAFNDEAGIFHLPETMANPGTREAVIDYINPILKQLDPTAPKVIAQGISAEALNTAMGRLGGALEVSGNGYRLKMPDGSTGEFKTLGEANRQVWNTLLSSGMVTPEEYGNLIYRSTGLTLKVTGGVGIDGGPVRYELWGIDASGKGTLRQYANSLEELSGFASTYEVKLPDFLMPDLVIRKGKVMIGNTVVSGPFDALRRFAGNFDDANASPFSTMKAGAEIKRQLADGSWVTTTTTRGGRFVQVEWPDYGISKTFGSMKEANEFFDQIGDGYDALQYAAARKGYRIQLTPAGTYAFSNGTDVFGAKSLEEAQGFLQKIPDKYEGKDLVHFFDTEYDAELADGIAKQTEKLTDEILKRPRSKLGAKLATGKSVWRNDLEAQIRPMQAMIDDFATRYNLPELADYANATVTARRSTEIASNRLKRLVQIILTDDSTGKLLPAKDRMVIDRLLQIDPGLREQYAQTIAEKLGVDFVYGSAQRQAVAGLEALYKSLGQVYNIDFLQALKNYSPNIREYADPDQLAEILKLRRDEIAQKVFKVGKFSELPELEFLSRNSRLDAVLSTMAEGDALKIAEMYVDNGTRELYIGPIADKFRGILADLSSRSDIPQVVVDGIKHSYLNLIGGGIDELGSKIAEVSIDVSSKIAKGLQAVSTKLGGDDTAIGSAIERLAKDTITSDIPSRASDLISQSTLGFKFARLLTNSAQITNTWAAYDMYVDQAVKLVDDDYIQELWGRGLLDEKIFAALEDLPETKFRDAAMMPNRISEFLTRAWTAKAQELAFDNALEGLSTGRVSMNQFVDLARMDWFPDQALRRITDLVKEGTPEAIGAARDQAMKQAIRGTMFDMAREDWPALFQTTLGRIFGKFGVYSAGQLEMYRSFATRGSWVNRAERVFRLVAGYTVVKNAFQIAGIDYDGFNITDPLAFSGSPLWNSLIDLTRVGGTGVESDLARRSLQRNWLPFIYSKSKGFQPNIPRLAFPGAAEVNSIAKGINDWNAGVEPWGVLLDFMGAPRMTQPWNGVQMPW